MAESAVQVEKRPGGFAVLTLTKEPVNSLNLQCWQQLEAALDSCEADPSISGLVISSGLKRDVFSAGNDLLELYAPHTSEARYTEFWHTSNRFLAKLYRSRLATVASIRGASPAGGCIIAMCCDHRIMTSNGTIGLNEVQLGIPVPKFWGMLMSRLIGVRASDKLLLTGRLVDAKEAKALGLVDEIVNTKDELSAAAEALMLKLVLLPGSAVEATKKSLRGSFCDEWQSYYLQEPKGAWPFLLLPQTLATLKSAIERLSGKKKPQQSKM